MRPCRAPDDVVGLIVLVINLPSRPLGSVVLCHRCRQPRLPYVRVCPTCGHLTEE